MWGALPYRKYVFLNLLTESGGGLEHSNSVVMMASRWGTSTRRAYLNWLGLLSHEFLHVWNVKRLRPVELGPFDYETENYTRSLWVAEGFTNYYDALTVHRAGLSTREEYLGDSLSGLIQALQTTPGRLTSSVEQASFDAWIKLYRPDENTANTSISYYVKGAVIAWLLDARIRVATNGAKSLDDLMRLAYERFSGARGFTQPEFRATAEEVAGAPLGEFFRRAAESTEELDYYEALEWFGLRFRRTGPSGTAWIGAETKNDAGRLVVTKILRGTPAFESGLSVDDEIVAIDGFRVRADQLSQRLENYAPGTLVELMVARREKMMPVTMTLGEEPARAWQLEVRPSPSAEQKARLKDWLGR
jgi:predicted metalloprotease with PDZ domain